MATVHETMIQPIGPKYRDSQIEPWSYYRDPIDQAAGRAAGKAQAVEQSVEQSTRQLSQDAPSQAPQPAEQQTQSARPVMG